MNIEKYTLNDLSNIAKELVKKFIHINVWCFYAEMGAGKTAIIKHVAQQLNVVDEVNSPTYAIMNEYSTNTNGLVFHFDFYRLKNTAEVYDIGVEDFFLSNNLCLVEWPSLSEPLLPKQFLKIDMKLNDDETRRINAYLVRNNKLSIT